MDIREYAVAAAQELAQAASLVDAAACERLADALLGGGRVFLAGAGRSGYMIRAFAMRLMHMGFSAHVVGDAATPVSRAGDLLLIGSGSGGTGSLVAVAGKAKRLGVRLALVTACPDSPIGDLADLVVAIPAPTPKAESGNGVHSIQPMGTLFEQTLLLVLDAVVMRLMERKGMGADAMFGNHANLE